MDKVKRIYKNVIQKINDYKTGRTNETYKKKSGGKEVIMEFALGAIAVVIAIVFREQLQAVVSTIGATFNEKIQSLFGSF
ncbi:MAG: hypothetical protein HFH14_10425 [Lachnospiraceae bacterium]|nr:hypothetical protein [Lachnospiraceae bacterium]